MIESFYAGDTINFTQTYSDYPSSDYTSILYINGPSLLSINGVASTTANNPDDHIDNAHLFNLAPSGSAYLKSGLYNYSVRVSSGSVSYTAEVGKLTVYQNPATTISKEFICVRMLDLIEKALLNQLTTGEAAESISIAGRSISMMSRRELLIERAFWNRERQMLINSRNGYSGIKQIEVIV